MAGKTYALSDSELQTILMQNRLLKIQREALEQQLAALPKSQAPCMWCPFDGVFRCEACAESDYEGFNVRDYPR